RLDAKGDSGGLRGAIGEKNRVGLERQRLVRRSCRWHDGHATGALGQQPRDSMLYTEVVGNDVVLGIGEWGLGVSSVIPHRESPIPSPLDPMVRLGAGHIAHQVLA